MSLTDLLYRQVSDASTWYRQPETFIAIAALIVSLSAVVVGIYEASLQRAHDRAEVWPHLELGTYTSPTGASVILESTGLGPGIVKWVAVSVDNVPKKNWGEVLVALRGTTPLRINTRTTLDHALRPGEKIELVGLSAKDIPPDFWTWVKRVTVKVCYVSAFDERWMLTGHLGQGDAWASVSECPRRDPTWDF
jgi:hypothetical protein